jgi:hypothetical protein
LAHQPVAGVHGRGPGVELAIPRPEERLDAPLPIRVRGLNPRWSAGFFQKTGYNVGYYGDGNNRYRPAGFDLDGYAYGAVFPDYVDRTHVVIGHPVVCDNADLFVQVTQKNVRLKPKRESAWHVSINNPSDAAITTMCKPAMGLPGFAFAPTQATIPAGGYVVLIEK